MVSTTGMVVSLKTDLRFPESGQQGHGAQIIQIYKHNKANDNLIYENQYILVNIINISISGECLLLESERVEYGEIYWKISI